MSWWNPDSRTCCGTATYLVDGIRDLRVKDDQVGVQAYCYRAFLSFQTNLLGLDGTDPAHDLANLHLIPKLSPRPDTPPQADIKSPFFSSGIQGE
jgi:hypothetical protein